MWKWWRSRKYGSDDLSINLTFCSVIVNVITTANSYISIDVVGRVEERRHYCLLLIPLVHMVDMSSLQCVHMFLGSYHFWLLSSCQTNIIDLVIITLAIIIIHVLDHTMLDQCMVFLYICVYNFFSFTSTHVPFLSNIIL